jgi:hypothetical protein
VDYLLDSPERDNHPFTDEDYLRPRRWAPKGGVAFLFHDGDSSFYTSFIAMSDSIYDGLGGYSAFAGIRIRGTCPISIVDVGTAGNLMTTNQLAAINVRQQDFELAAHGGAEDWLGNVGLGTSGNQVSYGSASGMSYSFAETVIGGAQDSAAVWGIRPFRSWAYSNWRMMNSALPDIFRANGIYQAASLCVPVGLVHSQVSSNGYTGMHRNDDQYTKDALVIGATQAWGGFQRLGMMMNPYDIGSRASWDTTGTDSDTTAAAAYIDACVQMQSLGVMTFHQVVADGARTAKFQIEEGELSTLMMIAASRVQEGVLESLTFEQLAARMRGIRDGNLIPSYGFRILTDGRATALTRGGTGGTAITAPISWPQHLDFYTQSGDTFVAEGGTATNPKVFNLSTSDTISASFNDRGGNEDSVSWAAADTSRNVLDSVSWAAADTSRNVLMMQSGAAASNHLNCPILVTGCDARYIMVVLQVGILNGVMPASPEGYIAMNALQFDEAWEDFANFTTSSWESMADLVPHRLALPGYGNFAWENQRVRVVGYFAHADTSLDWWGTSAVPSFSSATSESLMVKYMRGGPWRLPLYTINHKEGSVWDLQAGFGDGLDLTDATEASETILSGYEELEVQSKAVEYTWYVPVDERTDFVYVNFNMERYLISYTGAPHLCFFALEAYPIR